MHFNASNQAQVKTNDAKLEDMFSGLGLDSYLSGSSTTRAPAVPSDTSKDAGSLSMQEKQRYVSCEGNY